jgi:superfamily II DNA or RNA helicase
MKIYFDYVKKSNLMNIRTDNTDLFQNIRSHFSETVQGTEFSTNGPFKSYAITPLGKCYPGMFWEIRRYLRDAGIVTDISMSNALKDEILPNPDIRYNDSIEYTLTPRDYQATAIENAVNLGRGVIKLATGGGKTLITAALVENYYKSMGSSDTFKCLIVVPDLGLVNQTYNEIVESGISATCTRYTGKHKPDMNANVIIANSGILHSRYKAGEWVDYIDLLLVDEVHKVKKGNKLTKIIKNIKTSNKYGLTGTLPEKMIDVWGIMGLFGPVVYEKDSKSLRDEDYLSAVSVLMLDIHYKDEVIPGVAANDWLDEIAFISDHPFRNRVITQMCNNTNNNILVMVNNIDHGQSLYDTLKINTNRQVFFVRGEVDVEERDRIKGIMEESNDVICVAISAIFATGINIKNIHTIIFAAGGKSFVRTVQAIGRGLRKHKTKTKLFLIDIVDRLFYGEQHSVKRCETYLSEKIKYKIKEIFEP